MSKLIGLSEFPQLVKSGLKIGIGGFDLHRKPLLLVLALCESKAIRDLELFGISLALEADLLIGHGRVRSIISSYTGLENFGQCYFFREGVERGDVNPIEMSTYAAILSLQAAAMGLDYLPTRTMLYSDMIKGNGLIEKIKSYSDKEILAIKAYKPDIALLHASEADKKGNVKIDGPPANRVDDFLARAADKTIASVEKIVDRIENPTISGLYVDKIILSPGGSAPTSHYPRFDVDPEAMGLYSQGSKDRDLEYCKEVIYNAIERRREA